MAHERTDLLNAARLNARKRRNVLRSNGIACRETSTRLNAWMATDDLTARCNGLAEAIAMADNTGQADVDLTLATTVIDLRADRALVQAGA